MGDVNIRFLCLNDCGVPEESVVLLTCNILLTF